MGGSDNTTSAGVSRSFGEVFRVLSLWPLLQKWIPGALPFMERLESPDIPQCTGAALFMTAESALLSSIRQLMASRYSSRYSTSSISSFSAAPLRPRLHSQLREESSISSTTDAFSRYHGDTLDESWAESAGGCQGNQESGIGHHG